MRIYNSNALNRNSRFWKALGAGLCAAVVLGLAYGALISSLHVEAAILYLGIGWAIGEVIKKAGHGVGTQFRVLGAVLTVLAILIGDSVMIAGFRGFFRILAAPAQWLPMIRMLASVYFSMNISRLLGLLFRAAGIYFGYSNSSII